MPTILASDLSILVTHPGFLDAELMSMSSYSVIRVRDHELTTSPAVLHLLAEHGVELVSYSDTNLATNLQ